MVEDREGLLAHYRAMRADLLAGIAGLTEAQLAEPTIDGWSVKDHLAHLALWDDVRASEVMRISAGYASGWRMSPEEDEAYNVLGYTLRLDWSPTQARWELDAARQRLLDALAAATARGLDGSLYGAAALRTEHDAEHAGWIRRWRSDRGY